MGLTEPNKAKPKKDAAKPKPPKYWIGIGGSAGGLEALRSFVSNLPTDISATYIITQHMAPLHKSMLADIISRETSMRVVDVTDNTKPEANTVYITPPNANIIIKRGCLRLIEPSKEVAAPKPSVDIFFDSLATAKKKNAIGIIFSGTGRDGAKGLTAIRQKGGITVAQDEHSARYTSMPLAALETGDVDLVMAPEDVAIQIKKIIAEPRNLDLMKSSPTSLDALGQLVEVLWVRKKVNFSRYKMPTFQRRVERRMVAVRIQELDEYVDYVKRNSMEVDHLYKDLLISVTSFFRDTDEFKALKKQIERIVTDKNGDAIRVWIPGVATGEEAYSIAMMFEETAREQGIVLRGKLQIFATDLDEAAIEVARRGYYPEAGLSAVSPDYIKRYFDRGPKGFVVKKTLREKMVFSIHNVTQDPPFLNIDLVSCRNLLIYFQASLQAEVFSRFHYSLVSNGVLFVGKSEVVTSSDALFRAADEEKHIFFQRPSHQKKPPREMLYDPPPGVRLSASPVTKPPQPKSADNGAARFDSLVSAIGPNGLLIDADLKIIRSYGNVSQYVSINAGPVNTTASSLLKSPYKQDVQFTVPSVIRNLKAAIGVTRSSDEDLGHKERTEIYPIESGPDQEVMALVIFSQWDENVKTSNAEVPLSDQVQQEIESLRSELALTKLNLQQTVEALETSNEELQALNEEMQSSNEELQSTNEEMETSNEELQSTNEELSTVNEELQVNTQQLNIVNYNLESILQNLSMPVLVVDRSLNITHVSKVSERFFGIEADLALPHVSRCILPSGFPELTQLINRAMESGKKITTEVSLPDSALVVTTVPHFAGGAEVMGGIVIVHDNSELVVKAGVEMQLILDHVPAAIMMRESSGRIVKANLAAANFLGEDADVLKGKNFYDFIDEALVDDLRARDAEVIANNKGVVGIEADVKYRNGKKIHARMTRVPGQHLDMDDTVIYAVTEDITKEHQASDALKLSERRLAIALDASKLGIWEWDIVSDKVYWSDTILSFLGFEPGGFGGTMSDVKERIHPDDIDYVRATMRDHLSGDGDYKPVYRIRKTNGEYIHVQSYGKAELDDDGNAIRVTGTLEDVSQKRANLLALQASEAQMKMATHLSGVGYWELNHAENTVFWSQRVFDIHGVCAEDYVPEISSAIAFYHPDDIGDVRDHVEQATQRGEGFEFEARIMRPDGEVRTVRSIGSPEMDENGKALIVYGVFLDVTKDKQRQASLENALTKLSRSNEELNRFSSICSNDMREPVRMIEAMSSLVIDPSFETDDGKRMELFKRINKNSIRLRSIIESLLTYSQVDSKIEISTVNLQEIANNVCQNLAAMIEEDGADVAVLTLPTIRGGEQHFYQMFENLINNAIKFNNNKNPKVRVSSSEVEKGWLIFVDDNGPGIATQSRSNVFELFGRLKRKDEVEGSGLGLSIAEKIVHQYDGEITCSESPLGGARFEVFLPMDII